MKTGLFSRPPIRIWIIVVSIAVFALGVGIVSNWPKDSATSPQQTQPTLIGQVRPAFTLPDLVGAQRAIKEWDGKVVAVNFWATWCEPCRDEIADFNALQRQYAAKGLQFVGVAIDDKEAVQSYLKTRNIAYPVLIGGEDEFTKVAARYGNDEGIVPYTAFIDRKGRIAFIQPGELSRDIARQIIESLL